MAKRFGRCDEDNWKNMIIREKMVNKKFTKYNGRVMFPSSHDIVDIPEIKNACYTVIEKLLKSNNELLITTKPSLKITKEIIEKFKKYKSHMQFRFTITSTDNELLSFWEKNAPSFEERIDSLILAYKQGFKTSVSIEPFLDFEPQHLVYKIAPYVTESIWIGPMNYITRSGISEEDTPKYEELRKNIDVQNLQNIYTELKDFPLIRFKDSMKIKLGIKTSEE